MMKALTGGKVENKSSLNAEAFYLWMKNQGKGIYIAGLDFHTGFIVSDGRECWFLHSDYINKRGVIKEKLNESRAFRASGTRYITCLTNNTQFLSNWLLH